MGLNTSCINPHKELLLINITYCLLVSILECSNENFYVFKLWNFLCSGKGQSGLFLGRQMDQGVYLWKTASLALNFWPLICSVPIISWDINSNCWTIGFGRILAIQLAIGYWDLLDPINSLSLSESYDSIMWR